MKVVNTQDDVIKSRKLSGVKQYEIKEMNVKSSKQSKQLVDCYETVNLMS